METATAQDVTENNVPEVNAAALLNRDVVFNFKKQKINDVKENLSLTDEELVKPEFLAQFHLLNGDGEEVTDIADAKYLKRRTVKTRITLPDFLLALPVENQSTVADILETTVASYVKQSYVDAFEEIGAHDWDTIQKWLSSRGQRGQKWDFSDETLKAASAAFGNYITSVIGSADAGKRLEAAAKQRFTRNAIQRQANVFDDEIIMKLQKRIDEFMSYVGEQDADNFEEWAPVYQCWTDALDRHLKADTKSVDLASVL